MSCRVRFEQTAAVIVMRFIVYAIVFATSFTVVALLIVLAWNSDRLSDMQKQNCHCADRALQCIGRRGSWSRDGRAI